MRVFLKKLFSTKSWKAEKWGLVALIFGSVITGGIHFFSQKSIFQSAETDIQLKRQHFISSKLRDMEKSIMKMESNIQSYSLTEDISFSMEVENNIQQALQKVDEIEGVFKDESMPLSAEFIELKKSIHLKIDFTREYLEKIKVHGKEHINQFIREIRGPKMSNDLVKAIDAFTKSEEIDNHEIIREKGAQDKSILIINNIGYVLGIFLVIFAIIYLVFSFRSRMELEESLVEAMGEVEKAAQIKEQFLANMSHELRTPLQAILGFASLLSREKLPEPYAQNVRNIQIAGDNLLGIVNDILDVSKIESGMMRQEEVPFNILEVINSVERMFQPKAEEKNIYLKTHSMSSPPGLMKGDPKSLTRILVNLISNAIKFTQFGGIDIIPEVVDTGTGELLLKVMIKDTGIGIPEDKLPFIFDRFEQADSKITRVYEGSGLGLYIVRELVELQKGCIEVHSKEGKGSTFSFEIPYPIDDRKARNLVSELSLANLDNSFEGVRILLVEDNLMNQKVLGAFLFRWGVDYDLASNGKMAIYKLERMAYHLILMDIQMPQMDGYSATEYIRQKMNINTPIIAMTAHAFAGEREKALGFGMNDYISKPVREQDLHHIIAPYLTLPGNIPSTQVKAEDLNTQNSGPDSDGLQIDYNFLLESAKGNKEYLLGIFELFIRQAPAELNSIETAMTAENFEEISKKVHSLKSTAGYAGMSKSFVPLLEDIEKQVKNRASVETLSPLIHKLEALIQQAIQKIRTEATPILE